MKKRTQAFFMTVPKTVLTQLIVLMLLFVFPNTAFAYKDCDREVNEILVSKNADQVWVTFVSGGSIYVNTNAPSSASLSYIDRFYSAVLTAQSTGRGVKVRFTDSNHNCASISSTYAFDGIWVK